MVACIDSTVTVIGRPALARAVLPVKTSVTVQ